MHYALNYKVVVASLSFYEMYWCSIYMVLVTMVQSDPDFYPTTLEYKYIGI